MPQSLDCEVVEERGHAGLGVDLDDDEMGGVRIGGIGREPALRIWCLGLRGPGNLKHRVAKHWVNSHQLIDFAREGRERDRLLRVGPR